MKLKNYFAVVAASTLITMTGCQSYSPSATKWEVLIDPKYPERFTESFRGYQQSGFPTGAWQLDGQSIKTVAGHPGADIMTRQMYENFELEFEWKVSRGGHGGVLYNVQETQAPPARSGPEYKVADDVRRPEANDPRTSAAALCHLIAPNDRKQLRPVGEFNRSKIVASRGHVEHWLNGQKVLEYEWNSPDLRGRIDRSPFAGAPEFMKQRYGYVVFQHHGETVWYRRIRIRRL